MTAGPRPIFLFSLPRSGSTLLQRLLAAHSAISTVSEPWLLLPLLDAPVEPKLTGPSDYDHYHAARGEFIRSLRGGVDTYRTAVSHFASDLYAAAAPTDVKYFLDKTPRYHRIADEIIHTFPEGRFIFLWRQPLAVAASMMHTWAEGRWNLYRFEDDLGPGLTRLATLARDRETQIVALKYEDLLLDPEKQLRRVLAYLDLPLEPHLLDGFASVCLKGRYGDQVGTVQYSELSTEPLDKWKAAFGNPLRRSWAQRYLASIDEQDLEFMGYSKLQLARDLEATPLDFSRLLSDAVRMSAGRHWRVLSALVTARPGRSSYGRIHRHERS